MNHQDATEIVFGLLLQRRIEPGLITADHAWSDTYQTGIRYMQEDEDWTQAGLIDRVGFAPITNAEAAVGRIEGDPKDYVDVLELAYRRAYKAEVLKKEAKKLERGGESDDAKIMEILNADVDPDIFVRGDLIDAGPQPHRLTFYEPIDTYCGDPGDAASRGVPDASLIIIGGLPGLGKTTILTQIFGGMAKHGKKTLLFSLEMTNKQFLSRMIGTTGVSKDERQNILISQRMMTSSQIRAEARKVCSQEDIYAIGVDHAELALDSSTVDEASVGTVYKNMAVLAKETGKPVFLIAPLNRQGANGMPRINQIRYSSMAEFSAGEIFLIYNPGTVIADVGKDEQLPVFEDSGYLIIGKSRYGFLMGGPGGIRIPYDGKRGWGDEAVAWLPLSSI